MFELESFFHPQLHFPSLCSKQKRIADLDVDISSDDVLIQRAESCVDAALAIDFTRLRVPLPFAVDDGESSAKFDKRSAVLQFRMPVLGVLSEGASASYAAAVAERRAEAVRSADSATLANASASPLVDSAALQQQFGKLVFSSPLLFRLI